MSAPRDRYLTRDDVDRLLGHVGTPHVRLVIIPAITTGARTSALLQLRREQVDFKHRTINFNQVGREQTNKRRPEVPLNSRAYTALEEASRGALTDSVIEWDGQPVKSIKKAIRMASRRSGVPCSPHVFRHTAGVWMAQADVPMQKIAQFLGHTSMRVTENLCPLQPDFHERCRSSSGLVSARAAFGREPTVRFRTIWPDHRH